MHKIEPVLHEFSLYPACLWPLPPQGPLHYHPSLLQLPLSDVHLLKFPLDFLSLPETFLFLLFLLFTGSLLDLTCDFSIQFFLCQWGVILKQDLLIKIFILNSSSELNFHIYAHSLSRYICVKQLWTCQNSQIS